MNIYKSIKINNLEVEKVALFKIKNFMLIFKKYFDKKTLLKSEYDTPPLLREKINISK